MKVLLVLVFCVFSPALGLGTVEEVEQTCGADQTCLKIVDCPLYKEKHEEYKSLSTWSSEKENLKRELKEAICNKGSRAVCCPCKSPDQCISSADCPYYKDRLAQYQQLKPRNPRQAREIFTELTNRICDKKKRYICCPPSSTPPTLRPPSGTRPDYLPTSQYCGTAPLKPPSNVVNGEKTQAGEFPFGALLGYVVKQEIATVNRRKITRDKYTWTCGGTLINQWYVLTAAHCKGKTSTTTISKLRLGEWNVAGYGGGETEELPAEQDFDITDDDIVVHEDFNTVYENDGKNIVNDIALIRLPRPATLNNGVQMACLPFDTTEFKNYLEISDLDLGLGGRNSTVIGWGKTNTDQLRLYNGVGSRILQKLQLPVLNNQQCKIGRLTPRPSQLCAGGELGKDSCRGDSGGPLLIQAEADMPWYVIGIVSFGSKECGSGRPAMYTRVSSFITWIQNNLK